MRITLAMKQEHVQGLGVRRQGREERRRGRRKGEEEGGGGGGEEEEINLFDNLQDRSSPTLPQTKNIDLVKPQTSRVWSTWGGFLPLVPVFGCRCEWLLPDRLV